MTPDQILAANPGLNPKNLIVGKKIFIPAAAITCEVILDCRTANAKLFNAAV